MMNGLYMANIVFDKLPEESRWSKMVRWINRQRRVNECIVINMNGKNIVYPRGVSVKIHQAYLELLDRCPKHWNYNYKIV